MFCFLSITKQSFKGIKILFPALGKLFLQFERKFFPSNRKRNTGKRKHISQKAVNNFTQNSSI